MYVSAMPYVAVICFLARVSHGKCTFLTMCAACSSKVPRENGGMARVVTALSSSLFIPTGD